ncbi:MAG: hypothetical protein NT040_08960 [Bacteroidetes bacterium]|nr:hypothetical protein [Bacteroidota bacterium]
MKKNFKAILFSFILIACMTFAKTGMAQAPPPPPAEKGSNTNKAPGGGAPLDGGLYLALALVAGFGAWKLYQATGGKLKIKD